MPTKKTLKPDSYKLTVLGLKAENVKRIEVVELELNGQPVVKIQGKNGSGKTSLLDAIMFALQDKNAQSKQPNLVNEAADDGYIELDFGDIVVTRTFEASGKSQVIVRNAEGRPQKAPAALLESLTAKVAIDPLAFSRLSEKEQQRTLLELIDLAWSWDDHVNERKDVYEDRRFANRQLKVFEAELATLPIVESDDDPEDGTLASLIEEQEEAMAKNRARNTAQAIVDTLEHKAEDQSAEREELKARMTELAVMMDDLEDRIAATSEAGKTAKRDLEAMPAEIDLEPIKERMVRFEDAAVRAAEAIRREEVAANAVKWSEESDGLTAKLIALDAKRDEALRTASMPIEGLGIDEVGITFQGHPFSQASTAEQIRVSTAIAMSADPTIRVLVIKDGSLLDEESMKTIAAMAEENQYQIFVELVTTDDETGVVLSEGKVASK